VTRRRAAAGAVLGLTLAVLTGCGVQPRHTLNGGSAARKISAELSERYPGTQPAVTCPGGAPVRAGQTFVCQVTIDGQPVTVTGTITARNGDFSLTPSAAIIPVDRTVEALQTSIRNQAHVLAVAVDCGTRTVVVAPVGGTFTCTATLPGEKPRPVTVIVRDVDGHYSYSLGAPAR